MCYDGPMKVDTNVAVVLRHDLLTWQKLNVAAFTMTGIASIQTREAYVDGSRRQYLPMLKQPVLICGVKGAQTRQVYERVVNEGVALAICTRELFATPHDEANRAGVRNVSSDNLDLVGISLRGPKKSIDRVATDLALHP